ncbi:MAG: phosphoribosylformylglycinamidine synthase subunit PurS [Candidatus Saccharibacteria bacterium]
MFLGKVYVTLKKEVLDPQGDAVRKGLSSMGYKEVQDVRVGKYIEVKLDANHIDEAKKRLDEMCSRLLANPIIEEYSVELVEV